MNLTIKTLKLQEMLNRVTKGAGNNKLIPLTQMLSIKLEAGTLTLCTTDGTNYLYIKEDKVEGEDFYTVVPVEIFSKLVSKMTCDSIKLEESGTVLIVSGNGKYSVPIQYEDSGEVVVYPNPLADFKPEKGKITISKDIIPVILTSVKPALAVTLEVPCYTAYYVGEKVVAIDSNLINALDTEVFKKPKLISDFMMELLSVMTADKITVQFKDSTICFSTPDCIVYGMEFPGLSDFPIESINPYLNDMEFKSFCEVPYSSLLQLLDRLSLFVGVFDNGAIRLTFTEAGLNITSLSANGTETIPYLNSKIEAEFTCLVDVLEFTKQVKAQVGETVKIYFGLDNAIKMIDGNVTKIVGLLSEDNED